MRARTASTSAVATHIKRLRPALSASKAGARFLRLPDFELIDDVEAKLRGRDLNLFHIQHAAG